MKIIKLLFVLLAFSISQTKAQNQPAGDLDSNYKINIDDLAIFIQQWLDPSGCSGPACADLDGENGVNWIDFTMLAQNWLKEYDHLVISEFMASNINTLLDGDLSSPDWIEIHNPTDVPISLDGWFLTDNPDNLTKWPFPNGITLKGGKYFLVFASGQDANDYVDAEGNYHTNFKLSSDGEYLALVRPDETVVYDYNDFEFDNGEYGYSPQQSDISYGINFNEMKLIDTKAQAKILIPEDDSAGKEWIKTNFVTSDDWFTGTTGIGFADQIEIETARELFVDLTFRDFHKPGQIYQWINHGTLGGYFHNDNTEVWLITPELCPAANFDGTNRMRSSFLAPSLITDNSDWSVEMWVYNPSISSQEAVVQWANDVGTEDGTTGHLGYGLSGSSGAIVHGGSTDMGYDSGVPPAQQWHHIVATHEGGENGKECIYVDGKLNAAENKTLNIFTGHPLRLGTANGNLNYTGALAAVRIHDGDLTPEQVVNNYIADANHFKVQLPPEMKYISPLIDTHIKQQMQYINSSAYIRIEFEVSDPNLLRDTLMLAIYYDDGFIAYLNGVEVAGRNAPFNPTWNSTATTERTEQMAATAELINISAFIPLLQPGTNVLAIHGLNWNKDDNDFLILPKLVSLSLNKKLYKAWYFSKATPRYANDSDFIYFIKDPRFSVERGFYDEAFQLRMATDTEGAAIRYTTNTSAPTETHGIIYDPNNPIQITKSTCLRAAAFKTGYKPSNIITQTYIFLDNVINQPLYPEGFPTTWGNNRVDYEMDPDVVYDSSYYPTIKDDLKSIPSLCIGIDNEDFFGAEDGLYANASVRGIEKPASIEWVDPITGETYQANVGLRAHGGVGRTPSVAKHSLRILAKSEYGPAKLEFPFFLDTNVEKFDSLVLRGTWNYSYIGDSTACGGLGTAHTQYMRDPFCRDTTRDMGGLTPYGRHVHLYVNGLYWGLYILVERPDDGFAEEHLGGDKKDFDVLKAPTDFGTSEMEVIAGNKTAWDTMFSIAELDLSNPENYLAIQQYLDIPAMIDYMLMIFHTGNRDAPVLLCNNYDPRNYYSLRKREPAGKFFFIPWDCEWSLEDPYVNRVNIDGIQNPHHLLQRLRANLEFRILLADSIQKQFFDDGLLTIQKAVERYMNRIMDIDRAIVGESARWGDSKRTVPYTRNIEWIAERNRLTNEYFPIRTDVVLNQLRDAGMFPSFEAPQFYINENYQHGGEVNSGDILSMSCPIGTIYYTTDGSDPREPGGQINPDALIYTDGGGQEITLIPENAAKKVLVPDSNIGTGWRGDYEPYNDSAWTHGTPIIPDKTGGVGYENDTGYEDFITYDVKTQMFGNMASCYIRIPFTVDADDLANILSLTLKVRCDDGFIAFINGTEVESLNKPDPLEWNSNCENRPDSTAFVLLPINDYIYTLQTDNNILAIHGLNQEANSSDFLISVELIATVSGTDSIPLTESTHVKARALNGSEWSALNEATFAVGPVAENLRITEIMYHPQEWPPVDPNAEFIELRNIGSETFNLNWVKFTEGIHFTFPNVVLDPNQYIVAVKDFNAFETEYGNGINKVGEYEGRLDNGGERIRLEDAIGRTILDFRYKDGWRAVTDGEGYSLIINNEFNPDPNTWGQKDYWSASTLPGGSPGESDDGPRHGDIVINEVLAHSHELAPDWIELHNTTDEPIDIGGWFLSDNDANLTKYQIAENTLIPANGYFVFYEDVNFGPFSSDPGAHVPFALSEAGEQICLSSALAGQLTGYREEEDFGASETGVAFGRYYKASTDNYNFIAMSENTPWLPNAYPKVGPIVISEIMYHPEKFFGHWYAEYLELYNITDSTVNLYDEQDVPFKFTDGIEFEFPPNISIPQKSTLLIVKDLDVFLAEYNDIPPGVQIFEWESGRLNNGGEKIEISMPGDYDENSTLQYIRIDRVNYSDGFHPEDFDGITDPWPFQADGLGKSLDRINLDLYGNDPNNWQAADPSPGTIPGSEWTVLTYDNFEQGWGNYTPGGEDALLYTGGAYAHQGTSAANIQDDNGDISSFYHTNPIDVDTPGYIQIKVEFWFYASSMEPEEGFLLQFFDGSEWLTVANLVFGIDFDNNNFYSVTIYIDEGTGPGQYNFPLNTKLKFQCSASSDTDDIYIDEITVSAK